MSATTWKPDVIHDPIEVATDRLVGLLRSAPPADVKANAVWALEVIASETGIQIALGESTDPVVALAEVAEAWAGLFGLALADHPERAGEILAVGRQLARDVRNATWECDSLWTRHQSTSQE